MKSSIVKFSGLTAVSLVSIATAQGQTVEEIMLLRGAMWQQYDAENFTQGGWAAPYYFEAGVAGVEGGTFTTIWVTAESGDAVELEADDDDFGAEGEYETAEEMNDDVPPGVYSFGGTGSTIGDFSARIELPVYAGLAPKRIVNFDALQAADPIRPITVEWEAFSDVAEIGFILVKLGYQPEEGDYLHGVWEAPGNRTDDFPGLTADTTSVVIPANTLVGSPSGAYDVWVEFYSLDQLNDVAAFPEASVYIVTQADTLFQIHAPLSQDEPLLGLWPVNNNHSNTEGWLGWLYVGHRPWLYSYSLENFVYVSEESFASESGGWVYVPRPVGEDDAEAESGDESVMIPTVEQSESESEEPVIGSEL